MRMRLVVLAVGLLLASAGAGPAQPRPLFAFHSGFWTNLHHYLHARARANEPLDEALPAFSTDEQRRWAGAEDFYRRQYARRSLLFDDELVRIKAALREAAARPDLSGVTIPAALRSALEDVAPVYRRHFWERHAAANRAFEAAVAVYLRRDGEAIARRLAASFDATWPAAPIPVDLVHDAGPPGNAYTVSEPTQITVAAADPRHRGDATLEILFHEASHRWDARLMEDVRVVARQLGVRAPGALWHGLLFYNAGAITADRLASSGITGYEMYMHAQRTFDNPGWHDAIARHWRDFLDGRISRREAVARVLRDLS